MNVGIIDADLLGNTRHRFPNLACMKLSSYHKSLGDQVQLMLNWDIESYDKVYISKVFIKTIIPCEPKDQSGKNEDTVIDWYKNNEYLKNPKIEYGGTGFFYDKASPLSEEIEHMMPDYHLYDQWVDTQIISGKNPKDFEYYTSYSIGYLTRKCFRGCQFCVNRNYKQVIKASPLSEFYDPSHPYICLLDDNFFGCSHWKELIEPVKQTRKHFEFKQGLDERLLTDKKCAEMTTWKYKGDMIFAFDNIEDANIIEKKASIWRKYSKRNTKFYCFCGFDREDKYTNEFWKQDILNVFARCKILSNHKCLPYIMRHENYNNSPYRGMYVTLARWANQPSFYKRKTFREFCEACNQAGSKSALRYLKEFEQLLTPEEKLISVDYYFGWK